MYSKVHLVIGGAGCSCFRHSAVAQLTANNTNISGAVAKLTIPLNNQLHASRHAMKQLRGNHDRSVGLSLPVLRYRTRKSATEEDLFEAGES